MQADIIFERACSVRLAISGFVIPVILNFILQYVNITIFSASTWLRPQPTNIHSMRLKGTNFVNPKISTHYLTAIDVGDAESINKADKNDNSLLITASKSHPSFKNYNSSEPTTPRTDDYRTLHNNIANTTVSNLRPLSAQSNSSQVSFQSQTGGVNTGKDLPPLGSKRPYATVEVYLLFGSLMSGHCAFIFQANEPL